MTESTTCACPACGGIDFSWTVSRIKRGVIVQFVNGKRTGDPYHEGHPYGGSMEVTCENCGAEHNRCDLKEDSDPDYSGIPPTLEYGRP